MIGNMALSPSLATIVGAIKKPLLGLLSLKIANDIAKAFN